MNLIENQIEVEFSPDAMRASVRLQLQGEALDIGEMRQTLAKAGVVFGLSEEAMARACAEGGEVVVASGIAPVPGGDGRVEYKVTPPLPRPDGTIPFAINNVRSGDVVAVVHPPSEGSQGMTVTGQSLPSKPGKRGSVELGPNVARDKEDPSTIRATVDGNVVIGRSGAVSVQPVVVIHGDLDLSIGNIDFVGSLVVEGDIKGDVSIRVGRNLDVHGGIEDATVNAGGDVVIRKGFIGHGNGTLHAAGTVKVHHVRNQTVQSDKDIIVELESIEGHLSAGCNIMGKTAVFVGGTVEADYDVEAKTIGSDENAQVRVRAGKRGKLLARLGEIDREAQHSEKQLAEVKEAVYKLTLARLNGGLPPEKAVVLEKLQTALKQMPDRVALLQEERVRIMAEMQNVRDSRIVVRGEIYENVLLDINGSKRMNEEVIKHVIFVEKNREVVPLQA